MESCHKARDGLHMEHILPKYNTWSDKMTKKIYNKLVRDKIPEVIEKSGAKCTVEVVDKKELEELLNKKLQEEVEEYLQSNDIEELADIVEVVYGILEVRNISVEELETIRKIKRDERGGFSKAIKLIDTYPID